MAGTFAVFCTTVALFDTNQLEPMQEYLFHTLHFLYHTFRMAGIISQ